MLLLLSGDNLCSEADSYIANNDITIFLLTSIVEFSYSFYSSFLLLKNEKREPTDGRRDCLLAKTGGDGLSVESNISSAPFFLTLKLINILFISGITTHRSSPTH